MKIYTVFYLFFLGFAVFYQLFAERRVDKASSQNRGKTYFEWTHMLITLTYYTLNMLAVAEYFIIKRKINIWVSFAGLALFLLGLWGRSYAVKTLQKYWSGDIEIRQGHSIIRKGPYAYVRHPAYLSMIIKSTGLCLVPNSYLSLVFLFLCYIPVLLMRMSYEEKILSKEIGEEYLKYKKLVPAFIPFFRKAGKFSGA
ncbi:hypothetical protein COY52_02865 [Candidatus Desantisbacteria bacterium CG_4_10_14_0_8_um_filter_48_22]|uniref:Uncharacterized protein n=1 Tax=Candidatus Desantisbacteria bacterium CG_4_10_14_0_8_um_filter_48_22 TaxID=1974543 RepID=A0A2M7SEM0_9BACT|nr:MAG: hypothetical protein AUJ67_02320 [Candidatus Desantisbacteria bacterium CG1_02_49_89]PIV57454.1 MAG: hypothetical protein COS16_00210 [Candidatus Desantisbacteria bacterium CG02_land_8_20_14_3_00_49_13]PIZ17763.1 MAG: hypothetical protein COY52_02865 [Candidatus Desantisbacteria bacterium CG_4_10_14_0_8_um_filter_48_22]PJB27656.1 MAG: hypothetical protein CO111_04105 [Candidatus Desantisbacteria bacterium CG_4_9_14_3_um_filter_50_7]